MLLKPASRFPADPRAVFVLMCAVFVGATALILGADPNTLEATLPDWGVDVWGATLVLGSATTLGGMLFQSLNGIIAEQIGSMTVAAATIFYSIIMFSVVGLGAMVPAGIILAWGLSCLLRWIQLQLLIRSAYTEMLHRKFMRSLGDR